MLAMDAVAIRKAGIEGWEPYLYEAATGGLLVTGAVLRTISKGPNKGHKTTRGIDKSTVRKVVVTADEQEQWEKEQKK